MRELDIGHIVDNRQSNSGLFKLTVVVCLTVLIGYLISSERYIFLGVTIFAVLTLPLLHTNIGILLIYLLTISIPFYNFPLFPLSKLVGGAGNVPVHSGHILAVILIFIFAIRRIPKIGEIKIGAIGKAILLIILAYFVSFIGVYQGYQNFTEYFKSLTNMLMFAMLYFAFVNSTKRQDIIIKIFKIWIIVSLFVALYGFYQLLGYYIPSLPLIPGTGVREYGGIPQVNSILKEPVPFVTYLTYPIIFMSVLLAERQMFPFKTLEANVLTLAILLTSFILGFSITGLLHLLIFALFYFLSKLTSSKGSLRKFWLPVSIGVAFLIVGVSTDSGQIFLSRFPSVLTLSDGSTVARVHTASIAWQEFLKHPLFGIGAGNFSSYTAVGLFPGQVHYELHHADGMFFNVLAEMGIIGVVPILLFFGTMFTSLRKVIRLNKSNDLNFHISRGLYFMLLLYLISNLFSGGWLAFWVWFNFSIIGSWVLFEGRRLKENLDSKGKYSR